MDELFGVQGKELPLRAEKYAKEFAEMKSIEKPDDDFSGTEYTKPKASALDRMMKQWTGPDLKADYYKKMKDVVFGYTSDSDSDSDDDDGKWGNMDTEDAEWFKAEKVLNIASRSLRLMFNMEISTLACDNWLKVDNGFANTVFNEDSNLYDVKIVSLSESIQSQIREERHYDVETSMPGVNEDLHQQLIYKITVSENIRRDSEKEDDPRPLRRDDFYVFINKTRWGKRDPEMWERFSKFVSEKRANDRGIHNAMKEYERREKEKEGVFPHEDDLDEDGNLREITMVTPKVYRGIHLVYVMTEGRQMGNGLLDLVRDYIPSVQNMTISDIAEMEKTEKINFKRREKMMRADADRLTKEIEKKDRKELERTEMLPPPIKRARSESVCEPLHKKRRSSRVGIK
jgi:hypothetical protein